MRVVVQRIWSGIWRIGERGGRIGSIRRTLGAFLGCMGVFDTGEASLGVFWGALPRFGDFYAIIGIICSGGHQRVYVTR
jgi:hypothetical protein